MSDAPVLLAQAAEDGLFACPRKTKGGISHGNQDRNAGSVLWRNAGGGHILPPPCLERERLCAGRPRRRPLAHRVRVRHFLFLRSHIRGLRRSVRLALRHSLDLDRPGQRDNRLAAGLVRAGPPHAPDDSAAGQRHHARVLRQALRQQGAQDRRLGDNLRIPHPLHRLALQRPFAAVCDGVQHRLHGLHSAHGRAYGHIRRGRRLHGHRDKRLHTGPDNAGRHSGGHRGRAQSERRLHGLAAGAVRGIRRNGIDDAGRVRLVLRPGSVRPAQRRNPHVPGRMGPAADGAEVLRHQVRKRHKQGHDNLHAVRRDSRGRLLLPGRLRPALLGQDRHRRQRLRLHNTHDT